MGNISVLEEILGELYYLDSVVTDKYVKCAVQANVIKYKQCLEEEHKKKALGIVACKIAHLVRKLK